MPWDRTWAVALENAKIDRDNPAWEPCVNFARGAKNAELMAIQSRLDTSSLTLSLTHPRLDDVSFCPDDPNDVQTFINWISPLNIDGKPHADGIFRVPGRGLTDTDYASISINSLSSLKSLSSACGTSLSPLRWRGNFWIDGVNAWEELAWVGKIVTLGSAKLLVREPIRRCLATTANPATGVRDVDTLGALNETFNHQNFGVYADVVQGGFVRRGDRLEVSR